ncbi:MAG: esterase-like activity of phytase family protein [Hyphomonadaceae bacterium]|nr:MAG: hypothetical protein FD160_3655 [Caulobacteraceae bacterium]MBT9446845.1 esterase-like activity of phytase family protein [Hyphomonadaceae bacterium]TPW05170.1 MAG: hypothetical protein FD124_2279 [Alphaproteobacteria bacterium]
MKLSRRTTIFAGLLVAALVTACATQGMHLWTAPAPVRVEGASFSGWGPDPDAWEAVRVAARVVELAPEDRALRTVGQLEFRGGLELASDDARFGGLSGLHVEPDGRLIAVTDRGEWFVARLVLGESGELKGLVDARMAAMRDARGAPFARKEDADAEEVTRTSDGRFAVSFERTHSIRLYDLEKKGPSAAPDSELTLAGTAPLKANESLEALAPFDDGLITAGEGVTSRGAPFWIVPLVSETPPPSPKGRTSTRDFHGLSSLALLPDGDYLAMERFFAPILGLRIHVRRLTRAGLDAGPARWEGETVADFAPPLAIDNFEGLAVVQGAGDATRVYMVSDDNFNAAQRTLLYAFDLKPPAELTSELPKK